MDIVEQDVHGGAGGGGGAGKGPGRRPGGLGSALTGGSPGDGVDRPLRSAVVVNPVRVEDLTRRRRIIEAALLAAGWPLPVWFETTPEDTGTGQARRAVEAGAAVVFVCGGDGTVRSVIAGLVGTAAALAVLPAGTGNLLATNLGLPDDPAEGVRLAVARGRRQVDVGQTARCSR